MARIVTLVLLRCTGELANADAGRLPDLLRRVGETPVHELEERRQVLAHRVGAAFGKHRENGEGSPPLVGLGRLEEVLHEFDARREDLGKERTTTLEV